MILQEGGHTFTSKAALMGLVSYLILAIIIALPFIISL